MATKNIILHSNNGTDYDALYPQTKTSNISAKELNIAPFLDGINSIFTTLGGKVHSLAWSSSAKTITLYNMNGANIGTLQF